MITKPIATTESEDLELRVQLALSQRTRAEPERIEAEDLRPLCRSLCALHDAGVLELPAFSRAPGRGGLQVALDGFTERSYEPAVVAVGPDGDLWVHTEGSDCGALTGFSGFFSMSLVGIGAAIAGASVGGAFLLAGAALAGAALAVRARLARAWKPLEHFHPIAHAQIRCALLHAIERNVRRIEREAASEASVPERMERVAPGHLAERFAALAPGTRISDIDR